MYKLIKISAPDDLPRQDVEASALPEGWRAKPAVTRAIGDAWLAAREAALLFVPSVVVPETRNFLINPAHDESRRIKILEVGEHLFDERLRPRA